MKKFPVGIQSFKKIIEQGYFYVDKTLFAKKLIDTGNHYFLSRPRRFGKSLFLNTLKYIFLGHKELFKGLGIYNSDYDWGIYPVLHFSFSSLNHASSKQFYQDLQATLEKMAKQHSITLKSGSSIEFCLTYLIEELAQKNPVVILVDEYDKPILDHLQDQDLCEENRKVLRSFFGTLKDLDEQLKFTFITGISRFSRASLFSGFNHLEDISLDSQYADLMGYTQEEIEHYFLPYLQELAKERSAKGVKISSQGVLDEMREWYNGYSFSKENLKVFNPFSSLLFLKKKVAASYWYQSGTPSFLIHQIAKIPDSVGLLRGMKLHEYSLCDISDVNKINLGSLMYQTGYLTLKSYDPEQQNYSLDFPNREVRLAFFHSLLEHFSNASVEAFVEADSIRKAVERQDISKMVDLFNKHLSTIPCELYRNCREGFFHAIIISILEFCNLPTRKEEHTNIGRIDLLMERSNVIYIFECKLDQSAEKALEQIKEKKYLTPYTYKGKALLALGINFSSKKRCISDWKAELFSEKGAFLKEIL